MERIRIIALFLALFNITYAQQDNAKMMPLKAGEHIPSIQLKMLLGDSVLHTNIKEFEDRLILIEFWSTGCSSCIENMPKMDSLQKKFSTKLKIILVTGEGDSMFKSNWRRVAKYLPKRILEAKCDLPLIIGDTLLSTIFPHRGNPFHVWIYPQGHYKTITFSNTTTEKNIQSVLDGNEVKLDNYIYYPDLDNSEDKNDSLIFHELGIPSKLLCGSLLTKYSSRFTLQPDIHQKDSGSNHLTSIVLFNRSIAELYNIAFRYLFMPSGDSVFRAAGPLWEVVNVSQYIPPLLRSEDYFSWRKENTFCYILKVNNQYQDIYKIMRGDLDRLFGLKSLVESRNIECWVLKKLNTYDKFIGSGKGDSLGYRIDGNKKYLIAYNEPMEYILTLVFNKFIRSHDYPSFLLNDLKFRGKISMQIPWNEDTSIEELQRSLRLYDLELTKELRKVDVLVIRNAPKN